MSSGTYDSSDSFWLKSQNPAEPGRGVGGGSEKEQDHCKHVEERDKQECSTYCFEPVCYAHVDYPMG